MAPRVGLSTANSGNFVSSRPRARWPPMNKCMRWLKRNALSWGEVAAQHSSGCGATWCCGRWRAFVRGTLRVVTLYSKMSHIEAALHKCLRTHRNTSSLLWVTFYFRFNRSTTERDKRIKQKYLKPGLTKPNWWSLTFKVFIKICVET